MRHLLTACPGPTREMLPHRGGRMGPWACPRGSIGKGVKGKKQVSLLLVMAWVINLTNRGDLRLENLFWQEW